MPEVVLGARGPAVTRQTKSCLRGIHSSQLVWREIGDMHTQEKESTFSER